LKKYPNIYTVEEFEAIVKIISELLDLDAYIEPKYDGSNVTVVEGAFYTRNLNPLPKNFEESVRRALGEKYCALVKLSKKYQVFFELGGAKNSPAGFTDAWNGDWDYRIFDLMLGSQFLLPEKVEKLCKEYGLKFVGFKVVSVREVLESWKDLLLKYQCYEGFVLKIFPPLSVLKKIPHHRQYNAVLVKFKHEYVGEVRGIIVRKKKEKGKVVAVRKPPLVKSEIMGAINKAHLELGDAIFDKKKAVPLIFRKVKEEAVKHNCAVPKASQILRYYMEYINKLKSEER